MALASSLLHRPQESAGDSGLKTKAEGAGDDEEDDNFDLEELPQGSPRKNVDDLLQQMHLDVEEDPGIRELKEKQQQLQSLIAQETNATKELFTKMEARPVDLQPHFTVIIPDTNCLISGLDLIKAILATNLFVVVIPLTVFNELEGLKKGPDAVKDHAAAAYEFLEGEFARKNLLLKAQTKKGSYLHNISLRTEEAETSQSLAGKQTNDDVILECCVFQLKRALTSRPSDTASPAMLLTDDRNLKVKALARGVPVADCFDFERSLVRLVQKLQHK